MIPRNQRESGLKERLARAARNAPDRCIPRYERVAGKVRTAPGFVETLTRAKALAVEKRLLAVFLLKENQELCACEIQSGLGLTHATVSHHMGVLVRAGLVKVRRRGRWIYYSLDGNGKWDEI